MKRATQLSFIIILSLTFSTLAWGQEAPPPLLRVAKAIECSQQRDFSGWAREQVKPITGSENVLVEMFVSAGRRVKVSIVYYASELEASNSIQKFVSNSHAKKIPNLGSEAYAWGHSDKIAMRHGQLNIYVSAQTDIDVLLHYLDESEKLNLKRAEEAALHQSFARTIAAILSNLDLACQPLERY